MKTSIRMAAALLAALLAMSTLAIAPAGAFSNSSSLTTGGKSYDVEAYSCNWYWRNCSWSADFSQSHFQNFTHRGDVKANGWRVSVTISADPSAEIIGQSTTLATAREPGRGRSNAMSGNAKPSVFSVSVAARWAGGQYLNSGWTTW